MGEFIDMSFANNLFLITFLNLANGTHPAFGNIEFKCSSLDFDLFSELDQVNLKFLVGPIRQKFVYLSEYSSSPEERQINDLAGEKFVKKIRKHLMEVAKDGDWQKIDNPSEFNFTEPSIMNKTIWGLVKIYNSENRNYEHVEIEGKVIGLTRVGKYNFDFGENYTAVIINEGVTQSIDLSGVDIILLSLRP